MSLNQPIFTKKRMHYETPPEGISIGGYIARRLHKTVLLAPVAELIQTDSPRALMQIALYAVAASTSFGPALYQPSYDRAGTKLETTDPETGASVSVICEGDLRFSYRVTLAQVGTLTGSETITGTTVGWRGLGMPAPSVFEFVAADEKYRAKMVGVITSELAPGIGKWRIRGYGSLELSDSAGNRGRLTLDRAGVASLALTTNDGQHIESQERLTE